MGGPLQRTEVVLHSGEKSNALASFLAGVLKRNFQERTDRIDALPRLSLDVVFQDGKDCATVSFHGSRIHVYPWAKERSDLKVRGALSAVTALTRIPLFGVVPLPWSTGGIALLKVLLGRGLRIEGFLSRPVAVLRLLQALSMEERTCPFTWG